MITKEELLKRKSSIEMSLKSQENNVIATRGALQLNNLLLKEIADKEKAEKEKAINGLAKRLKEEEIVDPEGKTLKEKGKKNPKVIDLSKEKNDKKK